MEVTTFGNPLAGRYGLVGHVISGMSKSNRWHNIGINTCKDIEKIVFHKGHRYIQLDPSRRVGTVCVCVCGGGGGGGFTLLWYRVWD